VQWWWPETVSNRLPSNNFSFQRRTADTRAGPLRRVSLYHWSLFKKWDFAGISAGFSFVGAERMAQKTKWRERDSY
jgi:hypothetical protein